MVDEIKYILALRLCDVFKQYQRQHRVQTAEHIGPGAYISNEPWQPKEVSTHHSTSRRTRLAYRDIKNFELVYDLLIFVREFCKRVYVHIYVWTNKSLCGSGERY